MAIELACARLRTLPLEELAGRLGDRFRLLTGGSRTALPRHRTLLAVVEWSWDLLSDDERRLARRLSVFAGGRRRPAVVHKCVRCRHRCPARRCAGLARPRWARTTTPPGC
jgi:predicted ATPase